MADPTGREAFHVVAKRLGWSIERYEDGTYMSDSMDDGWQAFQAGRNSMREEAARAIEAEADRLERLDKGPSVLIREFAARFRDSK